MLTFEQIKELIELVASHRMSGLEVERSGFRLKIDGYQTASVAPALPAAPAPAPAPAPAAPAAEGAAGGEVESGDDEDEVPSDAHIITSPIVGTFYRAPNPEAPPFVEVGDKVKKGQVLCIVEAMKLMNEIESDVAGEVVAIFPKNAQPVEFGQNLFAIRTDG